jgi:hypothetical protein
MTQATTIGSSPEFTPPEEFRHGSGLTGQQEVARYAVQQGFTIDPALQQFAGHLLNEDPLGLYGRARGASGRQLINLAMSPSVSRLPGEYTMGELNAEVAETDPRSTFTMADVEASLAKTVATRRGSASAPQPSPAGQDRPVTAPKFVRLSDAIAAHARGEAAGVVDEVQEGSADELGTLPHSGGVAVEDEPLASEESVSRLGALVQAAKAHNGGALITNPGGQHLSRDGGSLGAQVFQEDHRLDMSDAAVAKRRQARRDWERHQAERGHQAGPEDSDSAQ